MSRIARKISESGYMHVIAKGNSGQILFEDSEDYRKYLLFLQKHCEETAVKVGAFCLMDNHVHLLTKSSAESLVLMMRKLGVSYSKYFNEKYDRCGHLFYNRFKSEPIEDERYLLTVFRYILTNPEKAGIRKASDYTWSSYKLYDHAPDFMDLSLIRELIGNIKNYKDYIESYNEDKCLEYIDSKHDDIWAIEEIKKSLGVENTSEIQNYDRESRDKAIVILKKSGLSIRQIERLTGVSRGVIQRIK